jgi:hypothetical protein
MPAQTMLEHLSRIRDGFQKVEAITRELVQETRQEALEKALMDRESILSTDVTDSATKLSAAYPGWHAFAKNDSMLKGLFSEAEVLMQSIFHLDEQIAFTVNRRMGDMKLKMGALYHSSRAACAYTRQTRMRAAR